MFPIATILKEKSSTSSRSIEYETLEKENIVIVQQECQCEEWKTVKHMALPVVTYILWNLQRVVLVRFDFRQTL